MGFTGLHGLYGVCKRLWAMEKDPLESGLYRGVYIYTSIWGLYSDNGKENGNYYNKTGSYSGLLPGFVGGVII